MAYKIELTLHELCLTIAAIQFIKAEFDYREDKQTEDRIKLVKRFERLLD